MNTFENLLKDFNKIYHMGYVKSVNNNKNSVGITIEKLLESTGGDFNIPDYYDIEIKALRDYYMAEFDLFNSTPDGKYVCSTQWLSESFGYPDKDFRNIKVFKGNVYGNKENRIGLFYNYKLEVDEKNQKIILNIYNRSMKLINNDIYWDFDSLKEKLERKLKKLAIFGFKKQSQNNELFIHYNTLKLYKLRGFNEFLKCIKNGYIFVTFKTGVNKRGPYIGKFTDHGTSFRISKNNIWRLFYQVPLVWDKKKEQFVLK